MQYTEYNKSVIPWVESFPTHWKQIRNGALFEYHQEKVGKDFRQYKLLSLTTQGVRQKDIADATGKVPASYEGYQKVNIGDMIFCLFDLDCSAVFSGLSGYHGMITSAYDVMKPRSNVVNPVFLDYWFKSVFAGRYYKIFSKSMRYTISYDVFKALKTPVPPRAEQDQIVRYLDWQVSRINKLIHGYQKQIKLLEERRMILIDNAVTKGLDSDAPRKTSKANWMGEVPLHWQEMRLKNFFVEKNERSVDGHEPHLSMSQKKGLVADDDKDIERRLLSQSYAGAKLVDKDDLVLNRLKAHLGVFALAPIHGVVSSDYTVLKLNQELIIPKYAEYVLKCNSCRKELITRVRGIVEGFWRLYTDDLGSIYICLPDTDEQQVILDYINKIEIETDLFKSKLIKQIDLFREYRTRLISDVVTGQMDVRRIEIPDYTPEEDVEESDTEEGNTEEGAVTNDAQ